MIFLYSMRASRKQFFFFFLENPAILSRLDDPSAEVRLYAAQCIGELKLKIDATTDIDSWKTVVKHLFDSLILHLDGPEIDFRKTLLGETID